MSVVLLTNIRTQHRYLHIAGEDFDRNLHLPNIDFVTYVSLCQCRFKTLTA